MYTNDESIFLLFLFYLQSLHICGWNGQRASDGPDPSHNARRECVWTGRKGKGVVLQASQLSLTALMILGERREGGMERKGRKARDVKTDTVWAGFQFRIFFLLDTFSGAKPPHISQKSLLTNPESCWIIMGVKANQTQRRRVQEWIRYSASLCHQCEKVRNKRVKNPRMLFAVTKIRSENVADHFLPSLDLYVCPSCFLFSLSLSHIDTLLPLLHVGFII